MVTVYADTSALAKLVSPEDETDSLRRYLRGSSVVAATSSTAFVGYGTRLLEAARQHHLTTVSPA